jgi:hypothetical protein
MKQSFAFSFGLPSSNLIFVANDTVFREGFPGTVSRGANTVTRPELLAIAALILPVFWTGTWAGEGKAPQHTSTGPKAGGAGPLISSLPAVIYVGDNFTISGSGFTPGSVVNFFVATSIGPENFGPLVPVSVVSDSLTAFLPASMSQGEGVASVVVVNTDEGHSQSNAALTLLQGDAFLGLPSLTAIGGVGLSSTSVNPGVAVANVETVIKPGSTLRLTGSGFDVVNGIGVDLFCDCPDGKVGPFVLTPGTPGLIATSATFDLPPGVPPAIGPGAVRVTNLGNFFSSAAVSVPIGARIGVNNVIQDGENVTVNGSGFTNLTAVNLFNLQPAGVVNLGGLNPDGSPKIPFTLNSEDQITFSIPAGMVRGPAYVQTLNPPFIPFTSSGNDPGGAFDSQ